MAFRKRYKRKTIEAKLQITSMMDMFTIILIFLLFSFSSNPEKLILDDGIELPKSSSKMDHSKSLKLVLSKNELKLDDEHIMDIENGNVVNLDKDNLQASVLFRKLKDYREKNEENLAETDEENPILKDHILFLCDRRVSFKSINKIIKTAGMAGYPNFQFAVLKK